MIAGRSNSRAAAPARRTRRALVVRSFLQPQHNGAKPASKPARESHGCADTRNAHAATRAATCKGLCDQRGLRQRSRLQALTSWHRRKQPPPPLHPSPHPPLAPARRMPRPMQ